MPSKQLPASIRYLKARLQILQRPAVWVSASVLLVAIVFLAETWKHPERLTTPNTPSFNSLSPADSESAETPVRPAPLDPFSSVDEPPFSAMPGDATTSPFAAGDFTRSSQTDRLPSPLLLPRPSTPRSPASSSVPDPFAAIRANRDSASPSSTRGSEGSTTNPYSSSGTASSPQNPFSASDPADEPSSPNPLQSAIDRSRSPASAQSSPSPASSFNSFSPDANSTGMTESPELQTPAAPLPGQGSGQSSFVQTQPLPGQPSYGQTQPQPQFIPQTSPAPGTTGYTLPPAFRTNANTPAGPSFGNYNNSYNHSSGVPSTVFPSTTQPTTTSPTVQPQVSQPQPQASPAPFSIPRTVPGRSIGGGQINTFSNP